MFNFIVICLLFLSTSSCSIMGNLEELLVLKGYSENKDTQHKLVKTVDQRYEEVKTAVMANAMTQYHDQRAVLAAFGQPILIKKFSGNQEQWLYRYTIPRKARDKVYLYFDAQHALTKWEKVGS